MSFSDKYDQSGRFPMRMGLQKFENFCGSGRAIALARQPLARFWLVLGAPFGWRLAEDALELDRQVFRMFETRLFGDVLKRPVGLQAKAPSRD